MSRYLARIVRAIVVSTLGIGGGVGLLVFISILILKRDPHSFQFAWQAGLIIGLLSALLLVTVWLALDLTARLFLAKGLYKEIWELEQSRGLTVEAPIKEVMQATRQALQAVPYVENVSDDFENLVTHAKTGKSWRSWGEELEVEINPLSENHWKLKCTSRPRSKSIVFDYGKNFENVEVFQDAFIQIIKSSVSTA